MIVLEKDVEGHITALRTDMAQVERLKVEVLELLDTLVAQINTQQMGIPLGNLLLPDLLAGTGPELPVKAVSLTMSNADFFGFYRSRDQPDAADAEGEIHHQPDHPDDRRL